MSLKKTFLLMFLFLSSFVIVTPVSIATPALPRVFLEPQDILDTSLVPGTQFTIDLSLDYVESNLLYAYQLTLSFNPEVLHGVWYNEAEGIPIENGPFLESGGGTAVVVKGQGWNNTKGTLWLFAAALFPPEGKNPEGGSDEHGPLATITFEVVGYGGSPITLGQETGLANTTGGWIIHKKKTPQYFSDSYFDNRPPIRVDPATVKDVPVGESFNVSVNVADMVDLYSWEFYMNWSAPVLNVTSVVEGDFLKSQPDGTTFYYEIHNDEGYIYVSCTRTGTTGVTGDGTLAQISFLVKSIGNSALHLYDTLLLDSAQNEMMCVTIDGFFDNVKFHDIAVTSVTAFPFMIEPGVEGPVYINVTVENIGDFTEVFNVTIYYDATEIDKETDISLDPGASITLTFTWDITGVEGGAYHIKAEASTVTDEVNTENNTFIYRSVIIVLHNISIVMGTTSASSVYIGKNVTLGVVVQNKGSLPETFNVTTYYNETAIETEIVYDLGYKEFQGLVTTWSVTDVEPGVYLIKAVASVVPDETDTSDNTLNFGVIEVKKATQQASLASPVIAIIAIVVAVAVISVTSIVYRKIRRSPEVW